jgi:hypothetical protein
MVAVLTGGCAALLLAAGPAGAQPPPPPQPGTTVGVAAEGNERLDMFYTGTDQHVWMVHMSPMGQYVAPLGGTLIGGPAAVEIEPGGLSPTATLVVFGRGTDNALWWTHETGSGWSRWASLGGRLTSKPSAAFGISSLGGDVIVVAVRGTDGAVWDRAEFHQQTLGWTRWQSLGGRLLTGTAPAVAINGGLSFAAVGTNGSVMVTASLNGGQGFAWHSIGGRTTASPGLAAPANGAVVAFARGLDGAAWYNEFDGHTQGVTAGWHSIGGRLTSGVTAITQHEGPVFGQTAVFGLGLDGRAWMDSGTWPALTGWDRVRVGA